MKNRIQKISAHGMVVLLFSLLVSIAGGSIFEDAPNEVRGYLTSVGLRPDAWSKSSFMGWTAHDEGIPVWSGDSHSFLEYFLNGESQDRVTYAVVGLHYSPVFEDHEREALSSFYQASKGLLMKAFPEEAEVIIQSFSWEKRTQVLVLGDALIKLEYLNGNPRTPTYGFRFVIIHRDWAPNVFPDMEGLVAADHPPLGRTK